MDTAYKDAQFVQEMMNQGRSEQEAAQMLAASKLPGGRDLATTFNWATTDVVPKDNSPIPAAQSINTGAPIDVNALKANLAAPIAPPMVGPPAPAGGDGATAVAPPGIGGGSSAPDNGLVDLSESSTSTSRKIYNPKEEKEVDDLYKDLVKNQKLTAELAAKQKEIEYGEAVAYAAQQKKDQEAEALVAAEEKRLVDGKMAEYDALVAEEANTKLDSNRFWTRMDTGNRILAGVSLALGALGQALTNGKSNMALDVIDKAIDRDIDEQKFNMDQTGKKVQRAQGLYQMYMQKVGNDKTARSLTREAAWRTVAADFKAKSALVGTEQAKQAALTGETEALAKAAEIRMDRHVQTQTSVKQTKTVTKASLMKDAKPLDQIIGQEPAKQLDSSYKSAAAARQLIDLVNSDDWGNVGRAEGTIDAIGRKVGLNFEDGLDVKTKLDLIAKEFLQSFSGMGVTDKELERFLNTMPNYFENPEVGKVKAAAFLNKYTSEYDSYRERMLDPYVSKGLVDRDLGYARWPSIRMPKDKDAKHGGTER